MNYSELCKSVERDKKATQRQLYKQANREINGDERFYKGIERIIKTDGCIGVPHKPVHGCY